MMPVEDGSESIISVEDDCYIVEQILDKKVVDYDHVQITHYLIKWKDYPDPTDYTWEPIQNLVSVQPMLDQFQTHFHQKKQKFNLQNHRKIKSDIQIFSSKSFQSMPVEESSKDQKDNHSPKKQIFRIPKLHSIKSNENQKINKIQKKKIKEKMNKNLNIDNNYFNTALNIDKNQIEKCADIFMNNESEKKQKQRLKIKICSHVIKNGIFYYQIEKTNKMGEIRGVSLVAKSKIEQKCPKAISEYLERVLLETEQYNNDCLP